MGAALPQSDPQSVWASRDGGPWGLSSPRGSTGRLGGRRGWLRPLSFPLVLLRLPPALPHLRMGVRGLRAPRLMGRFGPRTRSTRLCFLLPEVSGPWAGVIAGGHHSQSSAGPDQACDFTPRAAWINGELGPLAPRPRRIPSLPRSLHSHWVASDEGGRTPCPPARGFCGGSQGWEHPKGLQEHSPQQT